MFSIEVYKPAYQEQVIDLILYIQQQEFQVPISIHDQADLKDIDNYYKKGHGNFWVAVANDNVVGTVALLDIANGQAALRKMFVRKDYRGSEKQTGQLLLNNLFEWCKTHGKHEIYLGTLEKMKAACKFYLKNGFQEIPKHSLPPNYPVMAVDNLFFRKMI